MVSAKNLKLYLFVCLTYLLSLFFISPFENYAVGDDFYYLIQVKSFTTGNFVKNAYIDTSIILQIFMGQIWGYFFGVSFNSLRILTILFTLVFLFVLYKIFEKLEILKPYYIFAGLIIIFNPKLLYLSLSFNSEIYFLTFLLTSYLFLLYFEASKKLNFLFFASLFAGLSVMIRHQGLLMIVPIAFTAYLNFSKIKLLDNKYKLLGIFLVFLLFATLGVFWPKQVSQFESNSQSLLNVIDYKFALEKMLNIWREIPYFALLLTPFIFTFFKNLSNRNKFLVIFSSTILSYIFYQVNIFSIGNIVYLEGLDARSYPKLKDHLLNNNFMKIFFSYILSFVFVSFCFYIKQNFLKFKIANILKINFSLIIVYLLSVVLAGVYLERYFLYFEIFSLISLFYLMNQINIKIDKYNYIFLGILILISTLYVQDFVSDMKAKWQMASEISRTYNISPERIYFNDNYSKYNFVTLNNDLLGDGPILPSTERYKCFIVNHYDSKENLYNKFTNKINLLLDNSQVLGDFTIEGHGYTKSRIKSCSNCKTLFKNSYFSPLYDLYGYTKIIKGYCLDIKN